MSRLWASGRRIEDGRPCSTELLVLHGPGFLDEPGFLHGPGFVHGPGYSVRDVQSEITTQPVGPGDVDALAGLFSTARTTRHCWCMAFCTTRTRFAAGWFGGGNARRFLAMAGEQDDPMGVMALTAGRVVGWIACGPRSRYSGALREDILRDRRGPDAAADWFLPCVFVAAGHRRAGVSHALVRAAVELGRTRGATTVEGWPLAASVQDPASAFVGREQVFADLGFRRVAAPTPDRVLMRLDLGPPDPR